MKLDNDLNEMHHDVITPKLRSYALTLIYQPLNLFYIFHEQNNLVWFVGNKFQEKKNKNIKCMVSSREYLNSTVNTLICN